MCLYPKLILNRKYTATKKNQGQIPAVTDQRTLWVPIGCQRCIECRKQKARAWHVRLNEEIREHTKAEFITFTFSTEALIELQKEPELKNLQGYELDNETCRLAIRRFLERWRKENGTSVKHWLVTELAHDNTEHVHIHGIIWGHKDQIKKHWKIYGFPFTGTHVNEETVAYCVKYVMKQDNVHQEYQPKIFTSPGIGHAYLKRWDAKQNKYNGTNTNERYQTRSGRIMNLPIYYRNHIYSEQQREQLWLQKLDQQIRWVDGQKISTALGPDDYYIALHQARLKNKRLKYGDDAINWDRKVYETHRRNLLREKRKAKLFQTSNNSPTIT